MRTHKQIIRNMTLEDLINVVKWAELEGWNPGIFDAECFFKTDNKGFYVGEINGEIISALSVVKYDQTFAFLGFYIVKPEYRGSGYGFDLWKNILLRHDSYNIGLDGVVQQQENYKKSGFKLAHQNIRYKGRKKRDLASADTVKTDKIKFHRVLQYDRKHFPSERKGFLKHWLSGKNSKSVAMLGQDCMTGYGVIRKCISGYKIGPLFADTPEIAENIFAALINTLNLGDEFYLDIPKTNPEAGKLVQRHDMKSVFETARMYTKTFPELLSEHIYGITSFELG